MPRKDAPRKNSEALDRLRRFDTPREARIDRAFALFCGVAPVILFFVASPIAGLAAAFLAPAILSIWHVVRYSSLAVGYAGREFREQLHLAGLSPFDCLSARLEGPWRRLSNDMCVAAWFPILVGGFSGAVVPLLFPMVVLIYLFDSPRELENLFSWTLFVGASLVGFGVPLAAYRAGVDGVWQAAIRTCEGKSEASFSAVHRAVGRQGGLWLGFGSLGAGGIGLPFALETKESPLLLAGLALLLGAYGVVVLKRAIRSAQEFRELARARMDSFD